MCGCSGTNLSYGTNTVARGVAVGSSAPLSRFSYEVTHPDGTKHTFATDGEAYGDIRRHPGAGMRLVVNE